MTTTLRVVIGLVALVALILASGNGRLTPRSGEEMFDDFRSIASDPDLNADGISRLLLALNSANEQERDVARAAIAEAITLQKATDQEIRVRLEDILASQLFAQSGEDLVGSLLAVRNARLASRRDVKARLEYIEQTATSPRVRTFATIALGKRPNPEPEHPPHQESPS